MHTSREFLRSCVSDVDLDAGSLRFDYSPRGSYGKRCPAFTGTLQDFLLFLLTVGKRDEYLGEWMAQAVTSDSMGMKSIFYWTKLSVED